MQVFQTIGINAAVSLVSHIFFIGITFYAIQAFRLDALFKKGKSFQIQLIYILFSIAIGSTVSNFVLNFTGLSQQLPYIFS